MQSKALPFGKGFDVVMRNARAEAATMVIAPGETEGDSQNRHRGADQWLYVVSGKGVATVNGRRHPLAPRTLVLIEQGEQHEIRNDADEPLVTLNFYAPPAYDTAGEELPAGRR